MKAIIDVVELEVEDVILTSTGGDTCGTQDEFEPDYCPTQL